MSDQRVGGGATILVVDDEERNRALLDAYLAVEGYQILEAADGQRALDIIAAGGVDLVLLDVMMPGLDGIETCRRIRQELRCVDLPVVFVTAVTDRESRIRGKRVGADDFLPKPIDETELLVRVANLLELKAYHDLRERQRELLERELESRTAQLLRADRLATLGTLAGGVGHELNNITMVLLAYVDLLRQQTEAGQVAQLDDLDVLDNVGKHLKTHAGHLLSLGRPGPDHAELLDLRQMVNGTIAMLKAVGRTKHVHVEVALPATAVLVTVNRTRIEQVLVNLVGNAADAIEHMTGTPLIEVAVHSPESSGRVRCSVRDTGCGIPEDKLAQIFEPYYTTKESRRGTGLGLPVVRQIIESYGGALSVESRLGVGSTFTFDVPAAQNVDLHGT